jgi:hypothetical protein
MYIPRFDTFKIALHGNPFWIDDVEDPQAARLLLNQLASVNPGEDLAYEQRASDRHIASETEVEGSNPGLVQGNSTSCAAASILSE